MRGCGHGEPRDPGDEGRAEEKKKDEEEEVDEGTYYRMEGSYGTFERRIPIPDGIDDAAVTATYLDGVLEVIVPDAMAKLEAPPAREIPVTTPAQIKAA